MGLKEAQIVLDNPWNTYYAGQTVNGRVDFTFDSPKKVRGVYVKFKGEAKTSWNESSTQKDAEGKSRDVTTNLTASEEYFQISYYLVGNKSGGEVELPAGKNTYDITCALPPALPSSFEGEFGYVRYTVKVTLDRPWKFDQDSKMAFTVISPLDLNLNPSYKEPLRFQFEKTFCCCCCKSAPLSIDIIAPVTGYCCGQVIPFEINVENNSNVQVHLVKIHLRKVVTFRALQPKSALKKSKVVIASVEEGPAPAGSTKTWSLPMQIPPLPPSNLINCGIMDLDYEIKVECLVSGVHMNLKDKKTITIGTVPLVGFQSPTIQPGAEQPKIAANEPISPAPFPSALPDLTNNDSSGPVAPADPPVGPGWSASPGQSDLLPEAPHQSLYPSLSQPNYQESTFNARSIQDAGDTEFTKITGRPDFAPRYPVYMPSAPSQ